jgi:hypothetical protein
MAGAAAAQKLELKLDALAAKAVDKAELDLDPSVVGKLMEGGKLPNLTTVSARQLSIRNYKFAKDGDYSEKDLDPLRKQLSADPGWSRVTQVRDKQDNVELYLYKEADKIGAFVLIACEPRELSVVYLVGEITPEQLKALVNSKIRYEPVP